MAPKIDWNEHKRKKIRRLYLEEDKSLGEVMRIMREEHNFRPTKAQYETFLRNSCIRKNLTEDEWRSVGRHLQAREQLGRESRVFLNNRLIPRMRVRRHIQRYGDASLSGTQDQHAPVPTMVSIRSPSPMSIQDLEISQDIPPYIQRPLPVHTPGFDMIQASVRSQSPIFLSGLEEFQTTPHNIRGISPGHIMRLDLLRGVPFLHFEEEVFDPLRLVILPASQLGEFMGTSLLNRDSRSPLGGDDEGLLCEDSLNLRLENTSLQQDSSMLMEVLVQDHSITMRNNNQTAGILQNLIPRVQTELLERYEGRLLDELQRQTTFSRRDIHLHIIKFGIYFLSNNMFTKAETEDFLDWVISNGPRTISVLRELFHQKSPTIEAAVHNIFRSVVSVVSIPRARVLLASDVNLRVEIASSEFELHNEPGSEYTDLVRVLIKAADEYELHSYAYSNRYREIPESRDFFQKAYTQLEDVESAVLSGTTESVKLFLSRQQSISDSFGEGYDQDYCKILDDGLRFARTPEMAQLFLDAGAIVKTHHLVTAIEYEGDLELIRTLCGAGVDVNKISEDDNKKESPLMRAVEKGNLEVVELLLFLGAKVDNNENQSTELHIAASQGFQLIVEALLKAGADTNRKKKYGTTPLQVAAKNNHGEVVRLLLRHGAALEPPQHSSHPELLSAVENGNLAMVQDLLLAKADVKATVSCNYGSSVLEVALAKKGDSEDNEYVEISRVLQQYGADINLAENNSNRKYELYHAIERGDMRTIHFLLNIGVDVNEGTYPIPTMLCAAIRSGNLDIVNLLLEKGADVNAQRAKDDYTALQYSIPLRCTEVVRLLLDAGANPNAPCGATYLGWEMFESQFLQTISGCSVPLDIAIKTGEFAIIELLLEAGAEVNLPEESWSPLHRAATLENKPAAYEITKLLLRKGAFLNVPPANNKGRTILQTAIEYSETVEDIVVAELLIEAGENINARAALESGRTALQIAVENGNLEIAQFLLSKGADINAPAGQRFGRTALQIAVKESIETHSLVMVNYLLENNANVNGKPGWTSGRSALQIATSAKNLFPALIDRLLAAGADINLPACPAAGLTALQGAAIQGHAKLVVRLLELNANADAPGAKREGRTALEGAAEHGRLDIVQILLNAGVDSHLPPKRRYRSAIQFAESRDHFVIAKLLRERQTRDFQVAEGILQVQ